MMDRYINFAHAIGTTTSRYSAKNSWVCTMESGTFVSFVVPNVFHHASHTRSDLPNCFTRPNSVGRVPIISLDERYTRPNVEQHANKKRYDMSVRSILIRPTQIVPLHAIYVLKDLDKTMKSSGDNIPLRPMPSK